MSSVWTPISGRWWIWAVPTAVFTVVGILLIREAFAIPPDIRDSTLFFLSRRNEVLALGIFLIVVPYVSCAAHYLRLRKKAREASRLRHEGIPCKARILSFRSTGTTINDLPQYRMEVEVTGADLPSFRATVKACLGLRQLSHLGQGSIYRAWLDPTDRENLLISFDDGSGPIPTDG